METLSVATRSRCEMRDITAQVRELVARGRQQVAYQGRQTELLGHEAQDEGCPQTSGEGQDQGNVVRHAHGRASSAPGSHRAQSVRCRGPSPSHR